MAQIDLADATIQLKDGGGHTLTIAIGEGNLHYTVARNVDIVLSRGILDTARLGKQIPVDLTTSFVWEFITADTGDPPTIEDVLYNTGNASSWTTVASDPDEPYCVNIELTYTPRCSIQKKEVLLFSRFHYTTLGHSLKDGVVDLQGKAIITEPTATRVSQ